MKLAYIAFVWLLAAISNGQDPETLKLGAYRGIMVVTTTIQGVGETSASLRVKGRTLSATDVRFMAAPQLAQPVLNTEGDYTLVKLFRISKDLVGGVWYFEEDTTTDAFGYAAEILSFSIKGDVVRAEMSFNRNFGGNPVTHKIKVHLTRVGK